MQAVASFLVADGAGVLGAVLFSIILARVRGAEELGIFSFSMAQALLLQIFLEANFAITLPQEVARQGSVVEPLRRAQKAKWSLALLGFPVAALLTLVFGRSDAWMPTLAGCGVALVQSFVNSYTAALHGLGRMTLLGIVIAVTATLGALAGIVAVVVGMPLTGVILVQGLVTAVTARGWLRHLLQQREVLGRLVEPEFVRQFWRGWRAWRELWEVVRQRWHWIALGFLTLGFMRFGVLFLGWIGAPAALLGAYSAAQRFVVLLRILPNAFFRVFLPMFARERQAFSLRWAFAVSFGIGLPLAVGIQGLAPQLMELTFRIEEAVPLLQVMGWALPGVMLSHVVEAYALTVQQYQRPVVLSAAAILGLGFVAALASFPVGGGMAVAVVYVLMETLYALAVVAIVLVRRNVQSEGLAFPAESVASGGGSRGMPSGDSRVC
jgi:O-antigen/teichoic acid export membrane protein